MTEELKPCPFCGERGVMETFHDGFRRIYRVECSVCDFFKDGDTESEATAAWNERKGEKQ